MKNILFFAFIFFTHLFSTTLSGMDGLIHYMDENRLDRFHIAQLLKFFNSAKNKEWNTCKQLLSFYSGPLNVIDWEGYTPLHVAVRNDQEELVSILLGKKAPLTCCNIVGESGIPLHHAVWNGNRKIAQLLIDADIDKEAINLADPKYGNTAMHFAAWFDYPDIIQILIDAKADISKTNKLGSMPLHSASWRSSVASLKVLLECGADAEQSNRRGIGNTPLFLAAKSGSTDCLNALIEHVNIKLPSYAFIHYLNQECSGQGDTAIQIAAIRHRAQCYWNLVLAGANYYKKIKGNDGKEYYISEMILRNEPVKAFVKAIEINGKDNPPRYEGPDSVCFTCKAPYINNDVVLALFKESYHMTCFDYVAVEKMIRKIADPENFCGLEYQFELQALIKGKSAKDAHLLVRNNSIEMHWGFVGREKIFVFLKQ